MIGCLLQIISWAFCDNDICLYFLQAKLNGIKNFGQVELRGISMLYGAGMYEKVFVQPVRTWSLTAAVLKMEGLQV